MKTILLLISLMFSFNLWAHGCEAGKTCVEIESESSTVNAGKVTYEFSLIDEKNERVLTEDDLAINHEKLLHMFVYDPALKEFQHVHPAWNGTLFTVELEFSLNGNYFIYVQGMLKTGNEEFAAPVRLKVKNGKPENSISPLGEVLKGESENSVIELKVKNLRAGQMAMPIISFSRKDGTNPDITPWLGAKAHVVAVPLNGTALLHVHPMDTGNPNDLMIHTTFPKIGEYRLWVQFVDAGVLKTIPLSVKILK